MKTIWKFPLEMTAHQQVQMPDDAEILTAQYQGNQLCLWATVEDNRPKTPRSIFIYGTGHEVRAGHLLYINTVQQDPFVWHIFE